MNFNKQRKIIGPKSKKQPSLYFRINKYTIVLQLIYIYVTYRFLRYLTIIFFYAQCFHDMVKDYHDMASQVGITCLIQSPRRDSMLPRHGGGLMIKTLIYGYLKENEETRVSHLQPLSLSNLTTLILNLFGALVLVFGSLGSS